MDNYTFVGKWITTKDFENLKPVNVYHRQLDTKEIKSYAEPDSHILFRNTFSLKNTENTKVFISADDYYKLYINGKFVCMGPAPGYNFHYYYNVVDISEFVCEGENTVAIHTYYQGLINRVWVSGDDRHGLIMDIVRDDKIILCSDESFRCAYHSGFEPIGKYGYDTQFAQRYISGSSCENFWGVDYDDSWWENAVTRKFVDYELFKQPTGMLEFENVNPSVIYKENSIILDFGAVYVGYLNLEAVGTKGSAVELLFGQEYDDNGEVRWQMRANCDYREEWVLSGAFDNLNEFDYKTFRYVQINYDNEFELKKAWLKSRHYPFTLKAVPNTDDSQLLKIWDLCVNTLKYGAQEVIQDCMEREKGNYLGDGCYTALAYTVLTGDAGLLKKLIDDSLRSSFIDGGLVTCACCSFMQEIAEYPLMIYYALYSYYRYSGDKEYLAQKYEQLCGVLDHYRTTYINSDNLIGELDKWCVVEWPRQFRDGYVADITESKLCFDVHNVINAHFIGAVKYMNKICEVLGYPPYCDEKPFVDAFYREFYDEDQKLFKDMANSDHISMVSNIFPFMYDICREKETEEAIVSLIEERGFTTVMLFGAYPILDGLKRTGRIDLMKKCLKDEKAWLNMLSEGATRTFEGWSKDSKWNTSLFHLTLSYALLFLTDYDNFL